MVYTIKRRVGSVRRRIRHNEIELLELWPLLLLLVVFAEQREQRVGRAIPLQLLRQLRRR